MGSQTKNYLSKQLEVLDGTLANKNSKLVANSCTAYDVLPLTVASSSVRKLLPYSWVAKTDDILAETKMYSSSH